MPLENPEMMPPEGGKVLPKPGGGGRVLLKPPGGRVDPKP